MVPIEYSITPYQIFWTLEAFPRFATFPFVVGFPFGYTGVGIHSDVMIELTEI
jgi:hypothetical protein